MEVKDLLPLVFRMGDRIWLLFSLHALVALAVIGWLLSQRNTKFDKSRKIMSTIGYSFFFITICFSLDRLYRNLHLMLIDVANLTAVGKLGRIDEGYIGYLFANDYPRSIVLPLIACTVFYVFILVLIWRSSAE